MRLETSGPADAEVALLGVPFDGTSERRPLQARAPRLIRSALWEGSPPDGRDPVRLWDVGDVDADPIDVEATRERCRSVLAEAGRRAPDALPIVLGGEHTASLFAVETLEPASIVSLDAHPDLWDDQNGRATAHGTWLRRAVERLDCEVVLPMARAARGAEADAIEVLGIHRELSDALPEPVYLTVDVDVFDPQAAPSVVFPEPDGPPVEQVLDLVDQVASRHELCGVDVVEVNATHVGPTARLAARVLGRSLAAAVQDG